MAHDHGACEWCDHWERDNDSYGLCRRYPDPQPGKPASEWCSEYRGDWIACWRDGCVPYHTCRGRLRGSACSYGRERKTDGTR